MRTRMPVIVVTSIAAVLPALALACSNSGGGGTGGTKDSGPTSDAAQMMTDSGTTMDSGISPTDSSTEAATDVSTSDAGCNAGGADGGTCVPGSTPPYVSCADLTTPTVSFARDIQPVFNQQCAVGGSVCHGSPGTTAKAMGQVYLGGSGSVDAGQILSGLVGQPSAEDPQMNEVTAGDPAHSFLMHKLDGDQCVYAAACNATNNPMFSNCGLQQPFNSGVLDQATRDTLRRWIAQGAKDN